MKNKMIETNDFENIRNGGINSNELIVLFFIIVLAVLFFIFFLAQKSPNEDLTENNEQNKTQKSNQVFENLDLEAKAVFVWDVLNQKEIYSKNSESQLPLASLTKVAMAITALDKVPQGMVITINENDLVEEGDDGLFSGERWALKDLIDFSLIVSSNDGALAVASAIGSVVNQEDPHNEFIGLMNEKVRKIGLVQTYFISPSGLDKEDIVPGGNGSAKDMAILFEYAMREFPNSLEATSYPMVEFNSLSDFEHEAENTNDLVKKLPGIIASKTGFTDLAGGNLVVAFEPEPGRLIILVALGSSLEGRLVDIEKLYLTTFDYINS